MTKRQDKLDRQGDIAISIMITLTLCALFAGLIVIVFGSSCLLLQTMISIMLGVN